MDAVRQLTPEQKRAIFLKLRHDRPLTKLDLQGTGLVLMAASTESESLAVPREGNLDKLDQQLRKFGEARENPRPSGTNFAIRVGSISLADPKDRLSPELASDFNNLVAKDFLIYEIEVSSFALQLATRAKEIRITIEELRQFLGAIDGRIYEIDFAGCGARAVLSSTGAKFRSLVEEPRWWRKIIFFDQRPHFQTFETAYTNFNLGSTEIKGPKLGAETVCVIDTGVAAANPFLETVVRSDISTSFVSGMTADSDGNGHGSGVASLAAYYNIDISEGATNSASAFVASARITNDQGYLDSTYEDDDGVQRVRDARLLSSILKDAVRHFHSHGVRLFVLSFSIIGHVWSQATQRLVPRNCWVGRTIDQLSRDYDVVFITITGNITPHDVEEFGRTLPFPKYLMQPLSKVLDPGQAALSVTVGSIAHSERVVVAPAVPIAQENEPSPFTRTGPGFDESIKPDFVERGGNLVEDSQRRVSHNAGTNVLMASGKLTPPLQHSHGTSFAAPRVANHLAAILRDLRSIIPRPSAPLLRAFLALSARTPDNVPFTSSDEVLSTFGYGLPDANRATECSGNSAVLFYDGEMTADRVALFKIPVPLEIRDSGRALKRVVVAIATAPPVQPWGIFEYLGARLKFRLFRGDKQIEQIVAMMQREDGDRNLPPEIRVEDIPGKLRVRRRSAGTLQRDIFEWNDHSPEFSSDDYVLAVSLSAATWCKSDLPQVPIGIAVRLEDTSGACQQLYSKVRSRVQSRARSRA